MPPSHTPPVIVGGNRIPFARAGGPYARATTQDLLTTTLSKPNLLCRLGAAASRVAKQTSRHVGIFQMESCGASNSGGPQPLSRVNAPALASFSIMKSRLAPGS